MYNSIIYLIISIEGLELNKIMLIAARFYYFKFKLNSIQYFIYNYSMCTI